MEARLNLVTLGVVDLARSRAFYRTLGWQESSASSDDVAFFQLGGLVLSLFGREALAEDAGVPADGHGFKGVSLAQNQPDKAAVDAAIDEMIAAGATLVRAAHDVFWGGYSGYVADPDGHLWEIAWNPFWPRDAAGNMTLPPPSTTPPTSDD